MPVFRKEWTEKGAYSERVDGERSVFRKDDANEERVNLHIYAPIDLSQSLSDDYGQSSLKLSWTYVHGVKTVIARTWTKKKYRRGFQVSMINSEYSTRKSHELLTIY